MYGRPLLVVFGVGGSFSREREARKVFIKWIPNCKRILLSFFAKSSHRSGTDRVLEFNADLTFKVQVRGEGGVNM